MEQRCPLTAVARQSKSFCDTSGWAKPAYDSGWHASSGDAIRTPTYAKSQQSRRVGVQTRTLVDNGVVGEEVKDTEYSRAHRREYRRKVQQCLDVFETMLKDPVSSSSVR